MSSEKNKKDNISLAKSDSSEKKDKKTAVKSEKKDSKTAAKAEKKESNKRKRALKARAFKRGWFSVALVALFIVAVVVVNMIVTVLSEKIPALSIDMTGGDSFSLSENTLEYIASIDEEVTIYVLSDENDYTSYGDYYIQSNTLLHKYEDNSSNIKLKYIDLSKNPTFINNYPDETLTAANIIVQGEKDYKCLGEEDIFEYDSEYLMYGYYVIGGCKVEEAITSALLYVSLDEKIKVTFIADVTDEDYSALSNLLTKNGYEVDTVSPSVGNIPEDTSVLVLYAPTIDLDSDFVDRISSFLTNDGSYGKQLVYFPSYNIKPLPNIDSLLEEWGLQVEGGYAIENDLNYLGSLQSYYIIAAQYANSTYTQYMKNTNLPVLYLMYAARGISILDGTNAKSILKLSDHAQMMYPADETETADEAESRVEDKPGLSVGAIATKSENLTSDGGESDDTKEAKSSNIVVFAGSFMANEQFLSKSTCGNSSYILSVLNILTGRGNVGVTIESKTLAGAELGITSAQIYSLEAFFVILLPLAVLIVGIVIFVKRRNM